MGLCWLTTSTSAVASPAFPAEVQDLLGMECAPVCITCHTVPEGGSGTAKSPFGVYLRDEALIFPPQGSVEHAMMAASTHDSDGDGIFDTVELSQNSDPGSPENGPVCVDARYGCGARIAPGHGLSDSSSASALGALVAVGAVLFAIRRRRRAA